jgi:hypothetical protein
MMAPTIDSLTSCETPSFRRQMILAKTGVLVTQGGRFSRHAF